MAIIRRHEERDQKLDELLTRIIQFHQRGGCVSGSLTFRLSLPEHLLNQRDKLVMSTHTCSNQGVVHITIACEGVHDITETCNLHWPLWVPIRKKRSGDVLPPA